MAAKHKRFNFWGRNPLTIVEFIIAIVSIVAGIYIVSPLLAISTQLNGAGTLVQTLGHPYAVKVYGSLYVLSGGAMLAGIFKRRWGWRSKGLFLNIVIRLYSLLGVFVTQGVLPLTWVASLTIILIAIVCYWTVRGFIYKGIEP